MLLIFLFFGIFLSFILMHFVIKKREQKNILHQDNLFLLKFENHWNQFVFPCKFHKNAAYTILIITTRTVTTPSFIQFFCQKSRRMLRTNTTAFSLRITALYICANICPANLTHCFEHEATLFSHLSILKLCVDSIHARRNPGAGTAYITVYETILSKNCRCLKLINFYISLIDGICVSKKYLCQNGKN